MDVIDVRFCLYGDRSDGCDGISAEITDSANVSLYARVAQTIRTVDAEDGIHRHFDVLQIQR